MAELNKYPELDAKIAKLEKAMAIPGISADEKEIYKKALLKVMQERSEKSDKFIKDRFKFTGISKPEKKSVAKFKIGDYVSIPSDGESDAEVGIVKRIIDNNGEFLYRLDAYLTPRDGGKIMFSSEKVNEKYEQQLRSSTKSKFDELKKKFEKDRPNPKDKKVDLGFGNMGSGTTVWDRNRQEAGAYKNVAHINDFGKITYYDKNLPESAKKEIEEMAESSKPKSKSNLKFKKGDHVQKKATGEKGEIVEAITSHPDLAISYSVKTESGKSEYWFEDDLKPCDCTKKKAAQTPKSERNKKKVEEKKTHRETKAEKEKRVVDAEQFIKDVEHNADLRNMTEGQIIGIGLQFETNYRTGTAQKRDEKHDGKKRLSPTPENLIRWMKHPGDFDLIGVDTFERKDATSDYKREISKQKFWNNIFNLKVNV